MLQIFVLYHKTYVPPLTYLFNLSLSTNEIPSIWKTAYVRPLFKWSDPTVLNNYIPISTFSILSKVLESLVNDQSKEFLSSKNALSELQSGFRNKHSTSTAIIKVLNYLMVSLDNKKKHSAALFIDLSKAFDFADHDVLKQRLVVGLSVNTVGWFVNYLSARYKYRRTHF